MKISIQNLDKRYNKEWIFKNLTYDFGQHTSYALVGANGSGKSTLLQIISGYLLPSAGTIMYQKDGVVIPPEDIYRYLSLATPYMEVIEEFTLLEHLKFHFKFRKLRKNYTVDQVIDSCYLQKSRHKFIKNFSSGMKQRLKLALCFYTDSEIILLDEPTSNLDVQGIEWYQQRLKEVLKTPAIVIIASNQEHEYKDFCTKKINLQDYKT